MSHDEEEDEDVHEEEEMLDVPANWDASLEWQRFMLEGILYDEPQQILGQYQWQHFAGVFTGTVCFLLILHAYLLHAGGGLVIVPEDTFLNIYSFNELKSMENAHLLRLGLPMPAMPSTIAHPPPLFRWSFLTAGGSAVE